MDGYSICVSNSWHGPNIIHVDGQLIPILLFIAAGWSIKTRVSLKLNFTHDPLLRYDISRLIQRKFPV